MTMARTRDFSYRDDAAVPDFDDGRPIIVFDGHCVFCSAWVRFVLNQDRRGRYRFIAAQTPLGDALYRHYGLETRDYETNMLIENGRAYLKSDATLRVLAGLGLPWSLAGVVRIVPRGWRDRLYGFIARHRLDIAGRRESCYVPTPQERARFLA
ncbi:MULTISPECIES: thiol-disulfide oxidoreductase DCC family protein [unclassified Rhizobium]|uniref:thiol-disulfide oxidoreductase DCC family protein n=1 Tax=unclassified Rhizobium TaxID=2613769 RepID=UPI001ADC83C4|nr:MULTISPECIES: thiol-disulfide oxidoreductase DCC family protein [unclassified Rhizobium]MBO9097560.1 thiol-disulfide oxidoreductase DCC family protein [Rhizobium sp. L58/93]MBO9133588.1 thiol-disulfide oxidoreductase DCC family protein [Rhizobium sp. B209b/85]MBO9167799.1 thiol-disulfide oxidoreductase DCC family protein [Rhizobium sp. L245/93]QXZ84071.1 thiol-disulfide oxidoreductase DCC family protein [Rhizobium sp. K1/93]QXZ88416.1 thiol-disulfide oxidoreductase DCC family protein [Rhizo